MLAAVAAKDKTTTSAGTTETASATQSPAATDTTPKSEVKTSEAAATTAAEGDTGYDFDEPTFVGARDLAAKIDGNEALKAALPQELRDEILANARIAEEASPYREIFGSPDEARVIAKAAQDFAGVQQIFTSITAENTQKGTSDLINKMLEMSALRDDQGNPQKRADGSFITDGTVTRFFNELFDRKFKRTIEEKINASGNDAAKAALDLVMESVGLRTSTAAQDTNQDPALVARKAELDAQEKRIKDQDTASKTARISEYTDSLNGELNTVSSTEFEKLLAPATGLEALTKGAVLAKLSKAVAAAIKADTAYQMEKQALQSRPMTPARRQAEVALAKKWLATKLARVSKPILAEAGISVSKKAASKAEAQAAREQTARGEVNGAVVTNAKSIADATNPAQARAQVADQLKTTLGRNPTDSEINIEMMLKSPGLRKAAA